jgi:hypothetical protein
MSKLGRYSGETGDLSRACAQRKLNSRYEYYRLPVTQTTAEYQSSWILDSPGEHEIFETRGSVGVAARYGMSRSSIPGRGKRLSSSGLHRV